MGKRSQEKHTGKNLSQREVEAVTKQEIKEKEVRKKSEAVLRFFAEALLNGC